MLRGLKKLWELITFWRTRHSYDGVANLSKTIRYGLGECILPAIIMIVAVTLASLAFSFRVGGDAVIVLAAVILVVALAWFSLRVGYVFSALFKQVKCRDKEKNDQGKKGVWAFQGGNRTGKSLNGFATLFYKSIALWKVTRRFAVIYSVIKKKSRRLSQKEYRAYKEYSETYDAYKNEPKLHPCLVTNVRVMADDGRASAELTGFHLSQKAKLPRPVACGLDESSNKLAIDLFKDREGAIYVDEFMRLYGHYTGDESLFVFMEQNQSRAYKGCRDSIQATKSMKGVKVLLEPKRLIRKINRMTDKLDIVIDNDKEPSKLFSEKWLQLYNRIRKIGVFELSYTEYTGNRENESIEGKDCKEYLPRDLPFEYNYRFFCTSYKAKDLPISLTKFRHDLQHEDRVDDVIRMKGKDVTHDGEALKVTHEKRKAERAQLQQAQPP